MAWEVRPAASEDVPALVTADWAAFGNRPTDEQIDQARAFFELDRVLIAVEDGRVVGTTAALSLELTVPGPAIVPTAGVTYVGVLPTHRRQGILTALLGRLLDDACQRGEPLSGLMASEGGIYRRFGYGVATRNHSVEIERAHARLRSPVTTAGCVRMLERNELPEVLPALFDRYRRQQPGEVGRSPSYWASLLRDPPPQGERDGARFSVVWQGAGGTAEGYVTYRVRHNWDTGSPGHTLAVDELIPLVPEALAGLWGYCFDVDLIRLVTAWNLPPDDPLWWMLSDSRRLRVTQVKDFLWTRILDVERALAARAYGRGGSLVLEVADRYRPAVAGRFRLDGGDGGSATCRRTDRLPDLALDVAELASAYLGGVRFATLARGGLVCEVTPGAVAQADSLFGTAPGPACLTGF